jgi:hypothetical protein
MAKNDRRRSIISQAKNSAREPGEAGECRSQRAVYRGTGVIEALGTVASKVTSAKNQRQLGRMRIGRELQSTVQRPLYIRGIPYQIFQYRNFAAGAP